tara:strand:+ start:774 stop:1250 length:477 start_codon:yes stop_codon:yes gene_type:complete
LIRELALKNYWLIKSEPNTYSLEDLENEVNQTTHWDGVRNYQARNNMQKMQIGDDLLFYYSNSKPRIIVAIVTVTKEAYPDHTAWDQSDIHFDEKSTPDNPRWFMVDVQIKEKFDNPIHVDELKQIPELENMVLFKNQRLSVQPVTKEEWDIIISLKS